MENLKKVYISDIKPEEPVVEFFLVRSKNRLTTRTGKPYLDLELQDKTGVVIAKMWDGVEKVDSSFNRGDIIKVKAFSQLYREQLQLKIDDLRLPASSEELPLEDFLPRTPRDVEEMTEKLIELIESVSEPNLAALLREFWEDDDLRSTFVRAPGARNIHHAYLGGLMEHTLNVTTLADQCAGLYPEMDRDLLVTMSILHDIGKMRELKAGSEIFYTREGMLVGHINLGLEMLNEKIARLPDFPEELASRCKHILLSHHGELEFGSPIVPKTPEAMVLHYLDNLDAKANIFISAISKDQNESEEFTSFHQVMRRNIYKGSLEEESEDMEAASEPGEE